ncbi:MAG: rod shape-determining protein MreC [Ruminiclostridium sp.]|nr:rod shape-determining protein MreC [Ruminiclostridium sp.]
MKEFFHSGKFKVIICIFALVFGIMIYAAISGNNIIFPQSVLDTISQPFVAAGKAVSDWVSGTIDTLVNAGKYKAENERLREMLTDMYGQLIDKEKTDEENEQYRTILGIAEEHTDYTWSPPCTVIARNAGDIYGGFTIDRGTADGIAVYDPVFTSVGLVGMISETSEHYSVVKTILSPDVNVGVMTAETRSVGVTENDAEYAASGCCLVSYVSKGSEIKQGDVVITSGSSVFPGDIMVGTVQSVFVDNNGLTKHAVITPTEDVFKVTQVFVVTGFEGKDDQ